MFASVTLTALLWLLAVAGGPHGAGAADCPADRKQTLHNEAKLHEDLLCAYHTDFRPVKDHKTPVQVKVRFAIKYLSFDALEETFTVHSWVAITWKDEFINWTPANYGDINETQLESHEIWTPRMALFNADASTYPSDSFYTTCLAEYDGNITCVPHIAHSGICRTSLRRWPYDRQNCTLYFGSWMSTGEQVNFTFYDSQPVVMDDYEDGPGWKLLKVGHERLPGKYSCCPNSTYPMLKYEFALQREAAGPAAIVVVPSIVVVTLTLVSLLLDIKDNVRLMLVCFSLFGHFTFLTEIGYDIPKHSSDTPIILLFVRDSMILTLAAIMLTLFLMSMRRRAGPAPGWAARVVRLLATGPARYVVFTEFDPTDVSDKQGLAESAAPSDQLDPDASAPNEWIQIANILNSCVFIICSVIYFILICAYIPYD